MKQKSSKMGGDGQSSTVKVGRGTSNQRPEAKGLGLTLKAAAHDCGFKAVIWSSITLGQI